MKLVDALGHRPFTTLRAAADAIARRSCQPMRIPAGVRRRMPARRVSAPTDGRACSEPRISFLARFHRSHAESSCSAPRRSAPGWPRAASYRPCRFPLSTARSIARSPRRASRARPSRTPTTGASPTGSPRTSTRSGCRRRTYTAPGNSGVGRIYHNSLLLTTHAVAALSGHQGPCRNDERARALARRLCDSPPWSERDASPEGDPQFHNPGWVESMGTREAAMDKSIDPKVAEALMYAWRARDVLRLPAGDGRPDRRPREPRARAARSSGSPTCA